MDILEKPLIHIGETVITPVTIITFVIILLIFILIKTVAKRILLKRVFPRHNVDKGAAKAYTSILSYFILFIGILIALSVSGIPVLGIFTGGAALLIGIGFGI